MKLVLFGAAELLADDGTPVRLPTRPTFVLLVALATSPGHRFGRQELACAIWPDSSPTVARDSLRTALSALRKALPENAISTQGDEVSLQEGLIECVPLTDEASTDEFLPGFDHEWVIEKRLTLRQERVRVLCEKAEALAEQGSLREALHQAETACAVDPLSDAAASLRVELHERLGEATEAAIVAQDHRRRAFRRLGVISDVRPTEVTPQIHPLVTAAEWLLDRNPVEALSLLASTGSQWQVVDPRKSLDIHDRALSATEHDSAARNAVEANRMMLLWVCGRIAPHLGEVEVALHQARRDGNPEVALQLAMVLSYGHLSNGSFEDSLREARQLVEDAESSGRTHLIGRAHLHLAIIYQHTGHFPAASQLVKESVRTVTREDPIQQADLELMLATLNRWEGKLDRASEALERARGLFASSYATRMIYWVSLEEAFLLEMAGDYERSDQILTVLEGLGIEVAGHSLMAIAGESRARIAAKRREYVRAAELLSQVDRFRRSIGTVPSILERRDLRGTRRVVQERLSPSDLRSATKPA